MRQELINELLAYLGELDYDIENCYDHFVRRELETKRKAVHELLDINYKEKSL